MIFFPIILIIGALTTFTDLKSKKIYNQHLVIGAIIGIIVTAYSALFKQEQILFHIFNGFAAFIIGFILHRFSLWRGGDAKLFTLYAFLMPIPAYAHSPCPNVVSLFACSFIAGMIILMPVFIKDILIHHKIILNDLLLPVKLNALAQAIVSMALLSWILFPVYYLARITNHVIILMITFLIFNSMYPSVKKEVNKNFLIDIFKRGFFKIILYTVLGFLLRLWLAPNYLSFPAITRFIMMITLSAVISTCIRTTFDHFKDYHERVPFAPLLFIGCLLSYTPFLTRLMHMVTKWNVLYSR